MRIGYARVSTHDQHLTLQLEALSSAHCERVFSDTASGKSATRPGLEECLSHLRKGDALVVWKLDRLGRSLKDLLEILVQLDGRGVAFESITQGINTATPAGRLFYHVIGALAEYERELIVERTRAGLAAARARGRLGGRPKKLTAKQLTRARTLLDNGAPPREVADLYHIHPSTLYRHLAAAAQKESQ